MFAVVEMIMFIKTTLFSLYTQMTCPSKFQHSFQILVQCSRIVKNRYRPGECLQRFSKLTFYSFLHTKLIFASTFITHLLTLIRRNLLTQRVFVVKRMVFHKTYHNDDIEIYRAEDFVKSNDVTIFQSLQTVFLM